MPTTGHAMKLRARPGLLLNVALVAWLGVMVMPCAVLASDGVSADVAEAAAVAPDCHGIHVDAAPESTAECCCDPLTITGGEGPKTQRADLVAAAPLTTPQAVGPLVAVAFKRADPPPSIDVGPPVYVATQRFRI